MKTIIALLTTTALVAGASQAMADVQASDEAASYALGGQASWGFDGAYNATRIPGDVRNSTFDVPRPYDFQAGGKN